MRFSNPKSIRGSGWLWLPEKVETCLFRRPVSLSLGGLLFSRARFHFTGRLEFRRRGLLCQVRFPVWLPKSPRRFVFALLLLAGSLRYASRAAKISLPTWQLVGRGDVAQGSQHVLQPFTSNQRSLFCQPIETI